MAIEIERKFLVKNNEWRTQTNNKYIIKQGYLSVDIKRSVRVRIKNKQGFITIKGITHHISRTEFEYEIPLNDAEKMMALCQPFIIEKIRHEVVWKENIWEIDEFYGKNKGLIIAELELESEQQRFKLPNWAGKEVSNDTQYYNVNLIQTPYSKW